MLISKNFSTVFILLLTTLISACGELPVRSTQSRTAFDLSEQDVGRDEVRYQVIMTAASMLGTPYKWGGMTPSEGFDCSGLVHYSYLQAGIELPRTSFQQYNYSQAVRLKTLKPGDLLFFDLNNERVSHVGIYLGDYRFVHAPRTGKDVMITSLDNQYWKQRLVSAGRVI